MFRNPWRSALAVTVGALILSTIWPISIAEGQSKKRNPCVLTQQIVSTVPGDQTYITGIFEVENRDKKARKIQVTARFEDSTTKTVIGESFDLQFVGAGQKTVFSLAWVKAPSNFAGKAQARLQVLCLPVREAQVISAEGTWGKASYDTQGWTFAFKNSTRLPIPHPQQPAIALYEKDTGKLVLGCDAEDFTPSEIPPGYGFEIRSYSGGCTALMRINLPKEENQYRAVARVSAYKE